MGSFFRSPFVSGVVGSKRPTGIFKPWDTPIGKILPKEMLGIAANIEPEQTQRVAPQAQRIKPKRPRKKVNTGTILVDEEDYGI